MKVLQVINSLATGGAEKLLLETIPQYKGKGIAMDILVLNGRKFPFYIDFENQGGTIISLGNGSVYNPLLIFKLVRFLKKYDIVHVHLFPALYWVAFAKWIGFSKTRTVFTEHSTSNRRMGHWLMKKIDRLAYSGYSAVICITPQVRENLKKHLPSDHRKLIVIENGIDLSAIENALACPKTALQLPENAKLLIQVASFQFPKDQDTVIRALKNLPDDVHLLLVGQGPLQSASKAVAQELGIADRVHFLGVRMDVPQLLKTADIVVLSSQYEGLSLSCIEGMASGKPFVASDVPGLAEIVSGAGMLFPFGDHAKLGGIVAELLQDDEKRNEIARKCQLRAQAFDSAKMIEKHLKLYQSLL